LSDGVTHDYLTDDGKLIEERFGENILMYYYGAQGILGFDFILFIAPRAKDFPSFARGAF